MGRSGKKIKTWTRAVVHSVVDEVLLVRAEPVALAAPLRELVEELGSLVLLDVIRLAMEN